MNPQLQRIHTKAPRMLSTAAVQQPPATGLTGGGAGACMCAGQAGAAHVLCSAWQRFVLLILAERTFEGIGIDTVMIRCSLQLQACSLYASQAQA